MKKTSLVLAALLVFALTNGLVGQQQTDTVVQPPDRDSAIIKKLKQIVEIQEKRFQAYKIRRASGFSQARNQAKLIC